MVRRFLFKIIIFSVIVCYFIFYKYNQDDQLTSQDQFTYLTSLIVQEQQLITELNIAPQQTMTLLTINQYNLPYIEGELLSLSKLTEHIVLASVNVTRAHNINLKTDEKINITYTGSLTDELAPSINKHYYWLIQPQTNSDQYYIQGGIKGIIAAD